MERYKIYTSSKMSGVPYDEQLRWRHELENRIKSLTDVPLRFVHPPLYYNYGVTLHKSEREIKEWELAQIKESNIVVVNLDGVNDSVGTHYELSYIDAINRSYPNHIFVIGIGDDSNIHPWIKESLFRCESNIESAARFITSYLLI